MNYSITTLHDSFQIHHLFLADYLEHISDFSLEEAQDFWKFICVDKGTVTLSNSDTNLVLYKNDIAFIQPNEFHKITVPAETFSNMLIIAFKCASPAMDFFQQKVFKIDSFERSLLAEILIESSHLPVPLSILPDEKPKASDHTAPFGTEQLILLHLQHFLIHLTRRAQNTSPEALAATSSKDFSDTFQRVTNYMRQNLSAKLTVEQICHANMIGRTQLQKIFQQETGCGIIEHFSKMKINAAKHMIYNRKMNFTQISECLGYTSVHYFSRQFKKLTGLTPSEYASSIQAIRDKEKKEL